MKIIKKILIIPLILLLFGCNNSFTTKDNKTTTENTTTIEETTKKNIVIENGDVHYTYEDGDYQKIVTETIDRKINVIVYCFRGIWVPVDSYSRDYDENGYLILKEDYEWDDKEEDWVGTEKRTYTYDEDGDVEYTEYYDWDKDKKRWVNTTLVYLAEMYLSCSKNVLIEASCDSSSSWWVGYVEKNGNILSITLDKLVDLGELESISGTSGTFKAILNMSTGMFSVELDNFKINGQRIYWNDETKKFYK